MEVIKLVNHTFDGLDESDYNNWRVRDAIEVLTKKIEHTIRSFYYPTDPSCYGKGWPL